MFIDVRGDGFFHFYVHVELGRKHKFRVFLDMDFVVVEGVGDNFSFAESAVFALRFFKVQIGDIPAVFPVSEAESFQNFAFRALRISAVFVGQKSQVHKFQHHILP